jgi:hypothetical protein
VRLVHSAYVPDLARDEWAAQVPSKAVLDFLADGCLGGLLDFLIPRTPWRLFVWLVVIALVVIGIAAYNQ